jgi:hypothetical protein
VIKSWRVASGVVPKPPVTDRVVVVVDVRPDGNLTVTDAGTGDIIPKRGSGAYCVVVVVPSAAVTVRLASAPICCAATTPPGRRFDQLLAL